MLQVCHTEVSKLRGPQVKVEMLLRCGDAATGSSDFCSDPPGQRGDIQTDAPVPALRFCGQLAKWTGNSTSEEVGLGREEDGIDEPLEPLPP